MFYVLISVYEESMADVDLKLIVIGHDWNAKVERSHKEQLVHAYNFTSEVCPLNYMHIFISSVGIIFPNLNKN